MTIKQYEKINRLMKWAIGKSISIRIKEPTRDTSGVIKTGRKFERKDVLIEAHRLCIEHSITILSKLKGQLTEAEELEALSYLNSILINGRV